MEGVLVPRALSDRVTWARVCVAMFCVYLIELVVTIVAPRAYRQTLNSGLWILDSGLWTLNPKPLTVNRQPSTVNRQPSTLNPKP